MKTGELRELNGEYQKDGNSIMIFYGRSDDEPESYVKEFIKDKQAFYYRAREVSAALQREMFAGELEQRFSRKQSQESYEDCFGNIFVEGGKKLVLVIDAFEHIVKRDEEFFQAIVKLKERKLYPGPVMILLCSSSLVWVEHRMETLLGSAVKKIDRIHRISRLQFLNVVRTFPEFSVRESVEVYGILGGSPGYLKCWDAKAGRKMNICKNILSEDGKLFGEARRYLGAELRELSVYHTILTEIAAGRRKLNELYKSTGYSRAKISVYLKNLMELDVVEKIVSFETGGWENAQKGIYQIKDTFINFWFKFVFPYMSDMYLMSAEEFYENHVAKELEEYLNRYFIQVCMEYIQLLNQVGKLPIQMKKMGTWVGKQGNIDIIAQNAVRENIVGICNWSEEKMSYGRYQELTELMEQAKIRAKQYYLFSATKFDERLLQMADEDKRFLLIDMTEL